MSLVRLHTPRCAPWGIYRSGACLTSRSSALLPNRHLRFTSTPSLRHTMGAHAAPGSGQPRGPRTASPRRRRRTAWAACRTSWRRSWSGAWRMRSRRPASPPRGGPLKRPGMSRRERRQWTCFEHKTDNGMVDVKNKTCENPGCTTRPVYNVRGQTKGRFCFEHKTDEDT
jgi:hypothetical protein